MYADTHTYLLFASLTLSAMIYAASYDTVTTTFDSNCVNRIAQQMAKLPGIRAGEMRIRERSWGVLNPELCKRLENGEKASEVWTSNAYTLVDGYGQDFTFNNNGAGFLRIGLFRSDEDAHAALRYHVAVTATIWEPNSSRAKEFSLSPDEVLFSGHNACLFRKGKACVLICIYKGEITEEESVKLIAEIANSILAELTADVTRE